MTFDDLPADWPTRPITDPALFLDVVDLCVSEHHRAAGAVYVLLCDPQARLVQPCALPTGNRVSDARGVGDQERRGILDPFATALATQQPGGGLVVVVARPGRQEPTRPTGAGTEPHRRSATVTTSGCWRLRWRPLPGSPPSPALQRPHEHRDGTWNALSPTRAQARRVTSTETYSCDPASPL